MGFTVGWGIRPTCGDVLQKLGVFLQQLRKVTLHIPKSRATMPDICRMKRRTGKRCRGGVNGKKHYKRTRDLTMRNRMLRYGRTVCVLALSCSLVAGSTTPALASESENLRGGGGFLSL